MAIVEANVGPLRMDQLDLGRDGTASFSPTNVRLTYEAGWFTDFGGSYSYSQAGISGTTTSIVEQKAGETLYSVTGANADAHTLFELIDADDVLGAAAYVLRDADNITGGSRADTLYGFGGKDVIRAGIGADTLVGGADADKLSGGSGGDFFTYLLASDSTTGKNGRDQITDFSKLDGDKIDLTAIDAIVGNDNPNDAFDFVRRFHNVAGELMVKEVKTGFLVMGDTDGNGVADFTILVQGEQPVETSFML